MTCLGCFATLGIYQNNNKDRLSNSCDASVQVLTILFVDDVRLHDIFLSTVRYL